MKRADFEQTLRMMEHVRHLSYEAETKREERRLIREYSAMHRAIAPFVTGKKTFSDASPDLLTGS